MDIVFIVGYAGSGKSYLSNEYKKKKFFIISSDEIIRNCLMETPLDIKHFGIYSEDKLKDLKESKNKFVKLIAQLIKKHKKVVIEGQLNKILIRDITRASNTDNFNVILVMPSNKNVYIKHLKKRFMDDPANYGRIGFIKILDEENGKNGLNDYIKNGIDGKIIKKLIRDAANSKYHKHNDLRKYYTKHFDRNLTVYLTN